MRTAQPSSSVGLFAFLVAFVAVSAAVTIYYAGPIAALLYGLFTPFPVLMLWWSLKAPAPGEHAPEIEPTPSARTPRADAQPVHAST